MNLEWIDNNLHDKKFKVKSYCYKKTINRMQTKERKKEKKKPKKCKWKKKEEEINDKKSDRKKAREKVSLYKLHLMRKEGQRLTIKS